MTEPIRSPALPCRLPCAGTKLLVFGERFRVPRAAAGVSHFIDPNVINTGALFERATQQNSAAALEVLGKIGWIHTSWILACAGKSSTDSMESVDGEGPQLQAM